MAANPILSAMLTDIDQELHGAIEELLAGYPPEYVAMFRYQLGWEGEGSEDSARGKRIRPLLVLLACQACGGQWKNALPAAAAMEMVHNFSLIHDDIQDESELRRGRPTVWVKWGKPQAINAGDAMLSAAHLELLRLEKTLDVEAVKRAVGILQRACLDLTCGQYLDIAFEKKSDLPLELYWQMVKGKTGSLLSASLGLGALAAEQDEGRVTAFIQFGVKVGAAFQVQDDWLGIWGDSGKTGKSATSDLVARKKTYPILLGIQQQSRFAEKWNAEQDFNAEDLAELVALLENEGHREATRNKFAELYDEAFKLLNTFGLNQELADPLLQVLKDLLGRIN